MQFGISYDVISKMSPRTEELAVSSLKIVSPPQRGSALNTDLWLKERHATDGAEGLWRIHDNLYDVSSFVQNHPGGSEWLELTKGTDITEAFEVHHLSSVPDEILKKFYVRKASARRNFPYTFREDRFYRTLKKEIAAVLRSLPKQPINKTAIFTDFLLVATFSLSILACIYWNYWLAIFAGISMGCLVIAAHNYFHMKDNFRMHYFSFSLMQVREWRVIHALSHHLHTNTVADLEISLNEPLLQFLPHPKQSIFRYGYLLYFPLYWTIVFHGSFIKRTIRIIKGISVFRWYDLVGFTLPMAMYLLGNQSVINTIGMWTVIVAAASFYFAAVAFNAGHHHPDVFHDGDAPRSHTDYDWGLSQLDTLLERHEVSKSHFLALTHFGDHALHHLFPTLDHGLLELLYPTFHRVCKDFNVGVRMASQLEAARGSFRQIFRTETNKNPPNLAARY